MREEEQEIDRSFLNDIHTVYKLRNWEDPNHKKILTSNEIWFANPISFNDPFDTAITRDFTLLDTEEKKLEYALIFFEENQSECIERSGTKEKSIAFMLSRLQDINAYQKNWEKLYFEEQNKSIGVFSATTKIDSNVMWGHYANNHQGFGVSLKVHPLTWIINKWCSHCGRTKYNAKFPEINPLSERKIEDIHLEINYKSLEWEYENEYRIIRSAYEYENDLTRKLVLPEGIINGVYLGLNMIKSHMEEITFIAAQKKIPVFKMIKNTRSFKLGTIQIY